MLLGRRLAHVVRMASEKVGSVGRLVGVEGAQVRGVRVGCSSSDFLIKGEGGGGGG